MRGCIVIQKAAAQTSQPTPRIEKPRPNYGRGLVYSLLNERDHLGHLCLVICRSVDL